MTEKLIITPRTKVYDILEAYPQLEEKLIEMVPAFEKLRNPVLRRTITRITNLGQAAAIAGVPVETLVNQLRKEVGQDIATFEEAQKDFQQKPKWVDELPLGGELDARPMLAAGEHPVGQVIADLQKLETGKKYHLITPFLPVPLIDKAMGLGFSHWAERINDNEYHIYFKQ
ncbi:MAG: DUF1858 domain-containing protein [Bacteroidales bacterium]|jgi:hypothetical protein|nr:DUF1858 domain-containing protein [Bacteroidales bacterium]NPV37374.1 DUF1858 domain-containing protein [Bacteroidales bacterium]